MEFTSYDAFRSSVRWALDADEIRVAQAGLPPKRPDASLDMVIAMGESRVNRDLRASTMVTDLSVVIASNEAALPADVLELRQLYFDGEAPLEVVPLDRLRLYESIGGGGNTRYAAQDGAVLTFYPEASGTLVGSYYARPEALRDVTWASATTFARYPEVYFYAALAEAAPLVGRPGELWENKFRLLLDQANANERRQSYSAGRLRVRAR